jgi:class 3 adenylate cyclase
VLARERIQRRLAAILAVDIAGYSRLMGADEEGTLAQLKAHRSELTDPKIEEYGGRIVKTTGDGILVEFGSVVDAVRCAVEIQEGMLSRNADGPTKKLIHFRIGVHVGDVIIDGDDIYGDGVNIAARLEGVSKPGGICVSAAVHDEIQDKVAINFENAGEQLLKNITRPVRVYRIEVTGGHVAKMWLGSAGLNMKTFKTVAVTGGLVAAALLLLLFFGIPANFLVGAPVAKSSSQPPAPATSTVIMAKPVEEPGSPAAKTAHPTPGYYYDPGREQIAEPPDKSPQPSPSVNAIPEPSNTAAYYKRGQRYAKNGEFLLAIKDFDEVIRRDPTHAEALNNRCWARAVMGELDGALKDCNQAIQLDPNYVDALDSRAMVNLKIGLLNDAIGDYDAALRLDPKHAASLYGRGIAKLRRGNLAAGNSDISAAKAIQSSIADEFAGYGIR